MHAKHMKNLKLERESQQGLKFPERQTVFDLFSHFPFVFIFAEREHETSHEKGLRSAHIELNPRVTF